MDYVDLYQIHRYDRETPIEETLEALNDVVRSGKARYIGASSMFAWQFAQALALSDRRGFARFVSMQDHYNLAYREEEREMLPLCRAEGIGVLPWSPLARGLLAGTRRAGLEGDTARSKSDEYAHTLYEDSDFEVADRVVETARRRGVPPARVALAWLLSRPGVTAPIVGASRLEHLDDAVASLDLSLSAGGVPLPRGALPSPHDPRPLLRRRRRHPGGLLDACCGGVKVSSAALSS